MNNISRKAKLTTLRQIEEMVTHRLTEVGPVMDDYDGGMVKAYDQILTDVKVMRSIINHTGQHIDQQQPGVDY
jgi:hypothetical protein